MSLDVFLSYAPADVDQAREFEKHLIPLEKKGAFRLWHAGRLRPGEEESAVRAEKLEQADIVLFLASSDYFDCAVCDEVRKRAQERRLVDGLRLVTILLRPADWDGTSLAETRVLPQDRKPVSLWPNQDQAWLEVVRGLGSEGVGSGGLGSDGSGERGESASTSPPWRAGAFLAALATVGLVWWLAQGDPVLPEAPEGMVALAGGAFQMGSSEEEVDEAQRWCRELAGSCGRSAYEREMPVRDQDVAPFALDRAEVSRGAFVTWLNTLEGLVEEDGQLIHQGVVLLALADSGIEGIRLPGKDARAFIVPRDEGLPISLVTWWGAEAFCRDRGHRLPSEAEWEFAARGAERRRFPWGDREPSCEDAVFSRREGLRCEALGRGPIPVTDEILDRTPEGVLHLGGNVSEWVADTWPSEDGAELGSYAPRIVRGGTWMAYAEMTRAAGRNPRQPDLSHTAIGFRCATSLGGLTSSTVDAR